jgi:RNA ligase (TIGR02306 family)
MVLYCNTVFFQNYFLTLHRIKSNINTIMKLASIETIKKIREHSNADSLEICEILGWQTVVKKGIHKEGDKVVFITIDTIVPRCSWSEFLADKEKPDKPIRIKNIKLRGEYSSGLVIPLSEFPNQFTETVVEGEDLTTLLGVTKYVKEIPANLSGENEGDFPNHLAPKTDEDNGLNDPSLVQEVFNADSELTVTLKVDGSSCTLVVENGKLLQVCSRNLAKKETENSTFWNTAKKLKFPEGWNGIIQGEIAGNGIQRNQLKIEGITLFVFQISQNGIYMKYDEMTSFCKEVLGCEVVPLVAKLKVSDTINLWENPLAKLQDFADKQKYSSGLDAEGIVVRPSSYIRSKSSRRPLGFKLINRNYKD